MSRKMVLVPETMLLELKGKLPKSPEFQATIGLGQQLDQIETRTDLTPEEKAALYGHQLYRYRNYLREARNQGKEKIIIPEKPATENEPADPAPPPPPPPPPAAEASEMEQQVIKSVPGNMQKKAGLLLDRLKKTKVLKWNDDGEISYRGKMIPDSNIVDLVTNTMKTRPPKRLGFPIGNDEFAQALKETNIPRDYVQNPNVIKAMERPGRISTPRPVLTGKDSDDDDDTGFQDVSSFSTPHASPYLTPRTTRKKESKLSDWVYSPQPSKTSKRREIQKWDVLRK